MNWTHLFDWVFVKAVLLHYSLRNATRHLATIVYNLIIIDKLLDLLQYGLSDIKARASL